MVTESQPDLTFAGFVGFESYGAHVDTPAHGFGIFFLSHHMWAMAEAFDRGIVGSRGTVLPRASAAGLPTRDEVFEHGAFGFATRQFELRPEEMCLAATDVAAIFGPEGDHFDLRDIWLTVALDTWDGAVPPLVDLRWEHAQQLAAIETGRTWACEPRARHELEVPFGVHVPLCPGESLF
jgi:hypothetical protein